MKKVLSIVLSLVMVLGTVCCFNISAFALSSSGYCGDNLYYNFNSSTGALVISGSGMIDGETFYENNSIKSVVINNGCIGSESFAFSACKNLQSISFPKSFDNLGFATLYGCTSLTSITVDSLNNTYDSRNNCNAVIETKTNTMVSACKATVIPSSVRHIDCEAFGGQTGITSYTIPEGVNSIEYCVFNGCSNLKSITLPRSLKYVGLYAFSSCSKLTDVYYAGNKADFVKIDMDNLNHSNDDFVNSLIHCNNGNMRWFRNDTCTGNSTVCGVVSVSGIKTLTYNGKAKKQNPTVKFGGKKLAAGTDYTVSYSNNKNVGKATVTLKGKGVYYGTIKKTFKINPKGTSITNAKKSKTAVVIWKRQKKQTTGYQIQLSTSKKFAKKATKTYTINNTTGNKLVASYKKGKKYYARVRTYKTVGSTKYYSKWSKTKAF
ncbi:MAG: leucine-rich repeat domain-containing protein [Eubacterium sp.]|nr:leucine-rich repeat domain-containing protein [Eubacterium sp.]MBR0413360.1 leucine-rich repeat domain-containing protein [Eubacterium sp.]